MTTPGSDGPHPPPEGHPGRPPEPDDAPYPPRGASPYVAPGHPSTPTGRRTPGRARWLLPLIGGIVALVVVAEVLLAVLGGGDPEVGDCLDESALQRSGDEVEVVDCDSDDAAARIVGIDDREVTAEEFNTDMTTCEDVSGWDSQLWAGATDDPEATGTIYCLESIN